MLLIPSHTKQCLYAVVDAFKLILKQQLLIFKYSIVHCMQKLTLIIYYVFYLSSLELLKRLGNEECDGNNLSGKHKQHRRASSGHAEKSGSDTDEPEQVNYTQDQVEAVLR